jgi:transketolase N-terminal domain/subunit
MKGKSDDGENRYVIVVLTKGEEVEGEVWGSLMIDKG